MSFELPSNPENIYDDAWFKRQSLEALRKQLADNAYPNYPSFEQRLWFDDSEGVFEPVYLSDGPWETSEGALPSIRERHALAGAVARHDIWGRPLHPWFESMVTDPCIRVVTGKGALWKWGPNYAADPIVFRHDLESPHLLLIRRGDTGTLALPGGFVDANEDGLSAAVRETKEETGLDIVSLNKQALPVYAGPVADLRATANAWIETVAFRFDILGDVDPNVLNDIRGQDDAIDAVWLPISEINGQLFGSHYLLIQKALQM